MLTTGLDGLDQQIIAELRLNGRQANTDIARQLGVSESTIRSRVQRLISEDIIRVTAKVNLDRLGYYEQVIVGVDCEPGFVAEVMRELATVEEVRYVFGVSGRYDILFAAGFRSRDELFAFLTERVGRIPGVRSSETLHVLRSAKHADDFWESPRIEHDSGH